MGTKKLLMSALIVGICIANFATAAEQEKTWGWRGDGTGKFSDANPPLKWGRISKTLQGLRVQADKPAGEEPGDAKALALGAIEDWLVLGPVDVPGENKDIVDKELLPGEGTFQPKVGDKIGELIWKKVKGNAGLLDLNQFYPDLKNKAVYACSYIYSPEARSIRMRMSSKRYRENHQTEKRLELSFAETPGK